MKHQKFVKTDCEISHSELYAKTHWLPNTKPKFLIGTVVKFLNPEMPDIANFSAQEWTGIITEISVCVPQEFVYKVRWLNLWEHVSSVEIREDMIVAVL